MVRASELAKEIGHSKSWVLKLFRLWCELQGVDERKYMKTKLRKGNSASGLVPLQYYEIPQKAAKWIKRRAKEGRQIRRERIKKSMELRYMGRVTISGLARELGVSSDKIKREFLWWCWDNFRYDKKKVKEKFYFGGIGYILPEEFVEYMREFAKEYLSSKPMVVMVDD